MTLARMKIYELRIYFKKLETLGLDKESVGWFSRGLSTKFEGYFQHPIQLRPRAKKENEGSHQGNEKLRLKRQKSILREKSQPWRVVGLLLSPVNHGAGYTMLSFWNMTCCVEMTCLSGTRDTGQGVSKSSSDRQDQLSPRDPGHLR